MQDYKSGIVAMVIERRKRGEKLPRGKEHFMIAGLVSRECTLEVRNDTSRNRQVLAWLRKGKECRRAESRLGT
ncbi:unnamed protein product [Colias eurytheme]|nr:unnamed protein product [Colias eurytheme]